MKSAWKQLFDGESAHAIHQNLSLGSELIEHHLPASAAGHQ
jgi:hypothetical protein